MKNVLTGIKKKIQPLSRDKKQNQFYSLYQEHESVLDIGVHKEHANSPESANHFVKTFRYSLDKYTGLGIEDMSYVMKKYPEMKFVQYSGGKFPFKDNEFDWAFSNAVIEHVGEIPTKIEFINEMCRVANNVFFTTPNKYFPIDSHTMVWFLHWSDNAFLKWRNKKNIWWPKERLNLVSLREIKKLMHSCGIENYRIEKNKILGLNMTFSVIIEENKAKG